VLCDAYAVLAPRDLGGRLPVESPAAHVSGNVQHHWDGHLAHEQGRAGRNWTNRS